MQISIAAYPRIQFTSFWLGVVLLPISWLWTYMLGWALALELAPYDGRMLQSRPPSGSWAREISEFFSQAPGELLPGLLLVAVSVILFIGAMRAVARSATDPTKVIWGFIISNLAITHLALYVSDYAIGSSLHRPVALLYGYRVETIVPTVIFMAFLIVLQVKLQQQSRSAIKVRIPQDNHG